MVWGNLATFFVNAKHIWKNCTVFGPYIKKATRTFGSLVHCDPFSRVVFFYISPHFFFMRIEEILKHDTCFFVHPRGCTEDTSTSFNHHTSPLFFFPFPQFPSPSTFTRINVVYVTLSSFGVGLAGNRVKKFCFFLYPRVCCMAGNAGYPLVLAKKQQNSGFVLIFFPFFLEGGFFALFSGFASSTVTVWVFVTAN